MKYNGIRILEGGLAEDVEIEIPSLEIQDDGGDEWVKVSTQEDFDLLVKGMGFKDAADFEQDTGILSSELIGKFWMTYGDHFVGHNRVYLKEN